VATLKISQKRKAVSIGLALASQVRHYPSSIMYLDYDQEADVLYISLKRPQRATDTIELEKEGILLHYRVKELVGITFLFEDPPTTEKRI